MFHFKRVHDSGTDAWITQNGNGWRVQINLRELNRNPKTITGYLAPTIDQARAIADKEVSQYGHVCNGACLDWQQVYVRSASL